MAVPRIFYPFDPFLILSNKENRLSVCSCFHRTDYSLYVSSKLFILFVNHYLFLLLLIKQTIVCYLSLAINLNVLVSRLDIAV